MSEPAPGRLRVLQVLGSSAGGVGRHVRQLGEALSAPSPDGPGWTVHVAAPAAQAADVAAPGGPVVHHPVEITDRPRPGDVTALRRLRALAAGADVVHAHGLRAGALAVLAARAGAARGPRPRVVVTLHNLPVGGRAVRVVSGALERVVVAGADVVLGVSGDLVHRAVHLGARSAERALVPAPPRPVPQVDQGGVRAALGLGPDAQLLVTVARLAPQKGLDTLLDAAGLLSAERARVTGPARELCWVVAGDGPLHSALERRVADERLPVRLLGRRGDVGDLLAAADVVVSSAVWEGQPIAVQEALALGAALVATDAGGTREVTGDDGAVLVAVGDAAALADSVSRLLSDGDARDELRARAREQAARLPDLPAVVAQLRRVYTRP